MIVVGDASPLIALSAVGHLELLKLLYGRILIPEAVHREIVSQPPERFGATEVAAAEWIIVQPVRNPDLPRASNLGPGESEAISLVIEVGADLLLVDDRLARERARNLGIEVIGSAGVLLRAKQQRLIDSVKLVIDPMISLGVLRVHPALYTEILTTAEEQT